MTERMEVNIQEAAHFPETWKEEVRARNRLGSQIEDLVGNISSREGQEELKELLVNIRAYDSDHIPNPGEQQDD